MQGGSAVSTNNTFLSNAAGFAGGAMYLNKAAVNSTADAYANNTASPAKGSAVQALGGSFVAPPAPGGQKVVLVAG